MLAIITSQAYCQIEQGEIEKYTKDSLGVSRLFYDDGKIEQEGRFIKSSQFFKFGSNIQKTGDWTFYYKNGVIEKKGKYLCDKKNGLWVYYNEKGEILRVIFFDKGKKRDELIFLDDKYWENKEFKDRNGEFPAK